jgi:hypothetical protein
MTHTFKLARRAARFRTAAFMAALIGLGACDNSERLAPLNSSDSPIVLADTASGDDSAAATDSAAVTDTLSDAVAEANEALPEAAFVTAARAPGVVFGHFQMKNSQLTSVYNGAFRLPGPRDLLYSLASARARQGRILVQLSGADHTVKNRNGTFSLSKWKAQVARFRRIKFDSYIKDGTLMGHFLIDEPDDPSNWGGKTISQKTVEEMAKYSKKLWPGLTTVIRGKPAYLAARGTRYKYLDAGWAMYQSWQGNPASWIRTQNAAAKRAGLKVIVGLNLLNGGTRASRIKGTKGKFYAMSASQVKSWGSLMLSESRSTACGFFNWRYDSRYHSRSDIKKALAYLSSKAKSAPKVSCR